MVAQSVPKPITVEECERVPNSPGGRYELHHGEMTFATFPVRQHRELQRRLRKMLEALPEAEGYIVEHGVPLPPKAMTTLAGGGAVEFWVVDPETRTVLVHRKASGMRVYGADEAVAHIRRPDCSVRTLCWDLMSNRRHRWNSRGGRTCPARWNDVSSSASEAIRAHDACIHCDRRGHSTLPRG